MGANAGAAALDLVRPAVGTGAVCHGQAGDGELDAVDGGAGHRVRCGCLLMVVDDGAGVNLPRRGQISLAICCRSPLRRASLIRRPRERPSRSGEEITSIRRAAKAGVASNP